MLLLITRKFNDEKEADQKFGQGDEDDAVGRGQRLRQRHMQRMLAQ